MKRIGYIAMQRLKSLSGQHVYLDTADSDKTIRLNSRTYTVAASIIGMQSKPRAGVVMTDNIYGAEYEPGINEGFAAKGVIGVAARPTIKASVASPGGNLTGEIIAFEANVGTDSPSTRTITGPVSCLRAYNNLYGTITNGVFIIVADVHGGTVAWTGFAKLPDDSGNLADLASAVTTVNGVIKVKIGTTTGYIPTYATYTPT